MRVEEGYFEKHCPALDWLRTTMDIFGALSCTATYEPLVTTQVTLYLAPFERSLVPKQHCAYLSNCNFKLPIFQLRRTTLGLAKCQQFNSTLRLSSASTSTEATPVMSVFEEY